MIDMSSTFSEMVLRDPSDTSYGPSSNTQPSSLSGSSSANGNGRGWSGKKWLVNESQLLTLFKLCTTCGSEIVERKVITHSSQIRIQWGCLNSHSGIWASCPDNRGISENNLLISAAIFLTGTTHTTIKDWAELLRLPVPKPTQFYAAQSTYIIPVIQQAYSEQHERIMERLIHLSASGQKIELCGDGRCDSPGKAEFYCIASQCNITGYLSIHQSHNCLQYSYLLFFFFSSNRVQ